MAEFERVPAGEEADISEVVRHILTLQDRFATDENRPLGRGTHAKGVCARAVFEIFDLDDRIDDPTLRARLARGPYAVPGRFPAVVRFANAEAKVQSDRTSDVRAMSFYVMMPGGPDGAARRVDFSMNNAPVFPINNVHDFAVIMRVLAAPGKKAKLKTLYHLSWAEIRSFVKTALLGKQQKRPARTAYQAMRYWSTVPFAHGDDEAVKYTALPVRGNPVAPLNHGPSELRDELLRHLVEDTRMSAFDFGVQFLDTEKMTHGGKKQEAPFWVENASVLWDEEQAPFHVVGRLTLLPASQLPAAECDASYIDVTEHRFDESRPLGGVNRGRWAAERQSRIARKADPTAGVERMPAPSPLAKIPVLAGALRFQKRIAAIPVGRLVRDVGLVALLLFLLTGFAALSTAAYLGSGGAMLPREDPDAVLFADQGWGTGLNAADRQTYYYTSQGAGLRGMRYSWFVNLEMPWGKQKFASPAVMRRYGFLMDAPTDRNPDGLPVGFTSHFDQQLNEKVLSITCAACHTGQLNVTDAKGQRTAVRIDGGQADHAFTDVSFGHFLPTMIVSLGTTATNPWKFNRFARGVLGSRYPEGKARLHRELMSVLGVFLEIAWSERNLYPTEEGYGRTDALARIANTVFGQNLTHTNLSVGNAPVSFPPVWNIWKFDWVQYNASVSQPMARNIGEAMGVGAAYALTNRYGAPLPAQERFRSTAMIENLNTIEHTLQKLQPPKWPESIMGRIDPVKAAKGRELFNTHCIGCHGPHTASEEVKRRDAPLKGPADPHWIVKVLCYDDIGTDPNAAVNFARGTVDITRTGMSAADLRTVALINLDRQRAREVPALDAQIDTLRMKIARLPAGGSAARVTLDSALVATQARRAKVDADIQQTLSSIDPTRLPVGLALSYLGTMIREKAYADLGLSQARRDSMDGFGTLDLPQIVAGYRPRPLSGLWATPPYLHNGSVPTIYALLSPVSERPTTFRVGSREFDTKNVGLKQPTSGHWGTFNTALAGNHNTGHEFGRKYVPWTEGSPSQGGLIGPELTPEERYAIIEHLKVRDDDAEAVPAPYAKPQTCAVPPADPTPPAWRRALKKLTSF